MYLCGDILHFSLHYNVKWFISTNLNRQVTDCYIIHNPAHLTLEQGWTIIFSIGSHEKQKTLWRAGPKI